jgi:hypothetical protein
MHSHRSTHLFLPNISAAASAWARHFAIAPLALALFAFSSTTARAQLPSPAPDGGYPGQNTAEGDNALFSLTTGTDNTAIGYEALVVNTTGEGNTAIGHRTLFENTSGAGNTAIGAGALFFNTAGDSNTAVGNAAAQIQYRRGAAIRPLVLLRFLTTQGATITQPMAIRRSISTNPGATTRLSVLPHSLGT